MLIIKMCRFGLVLPLALMSACGGAVITGPSAVTGGIWKAQSLETSAGLVALARPENYTVEFREAGQLFVKADCNLCSGPYTLSGDSLQIGALACTRAFCGAASSDTAFLDILTNARTHAVRGIELSIDSPKGVARFLR